MNGQSGFTLSTLGDETMMYMFPAQKTQRRTLFMMHNFNSNYYNNQAGVLFTMPISSGDINNAFLQQCSTVPSADPDLCSGVTGLTQNQTKLMTKHMRHNNNLNNPHHMMINHHTGNIGDSFMNKEDSSNIINGLQKYLPQYYNDPHKQMTAGLSKNNNVAALSTGESGTFKSTGLGGN